MSSLNGPQSRYGNRYIAPPVYSSNANVVTRAYQDGYQQGLRAARNNARAQERDDYVQNVPYGWRAQQDISYGWNGQAHSGRS